MLYENVEKTMSRFFRVVPAARPVDAYQTPFVEDDGGRKEAGYKGTAGDCCARAFAIASGRPYQEVYDLINELAASERRGKRKKKTSSARDGVYPVTAHKLAKRLGFAWSPTMTIGNGCKVHLTDKELPEGNLVVRVSKHYTAMINGVIHDTHDPSRDGTRCVYGYWFKLPDGAMK